jgi:hypothetical protein
MGPWPSNSKKNPRIHGYHSKIKERKAIRFTYRKHAEDKKRREYLQIEFDLISESYKYILLFLGRLHSQIVLYTAEYYVVDHPAGFGYVGVARMHEESSNRLTLDVAGGITLALDRITGWTSCH